MNKQKWILLVASLALVAATALLLGQLRTHQRLGAPGVKTSPVDNTIRVRVELPEKVLNYQSESREVDDITLGALPKDTSFGARLYTAPDQFGLLMNVVLMGTDRTSLHKPQFCLTGQGWAIDQSKSAETRVRVERPQPYDLPLVKLVATRDDPREGRMSAVYVYWFVADGALSASVTGLERMWWMARHLLSTGELQRWAYVSCFAVCRPGQEEATFERMKTFIAASVPDFQLTPRPASAPAAARAP